MIIEQLTKTAKSTISGAKDALAKFATDVLEHPEAAMMRSSTLFSQTAAIVVWTEVLNNAEGGATPEAIVKSLDEHIYYTAANPPHSSSQLANYMEVEKNRARAEALKYIQRLVRVAPAQPANTAP